MIFLIFWGLDFTHHAIVMEYVAVAKLFGMICKIGRLIEDEDIDGYTTGYFFDQLIFMSSPLQFHVLNQSLSIFWIPLSLDWFTMLSEHLLDLVDKRERGITWCLA